MSSYQSPPDRRPLVTVLIPTYNRAGMVQEAIASVKAQSYPNVELIVVDDGSSDDTCARLAGRGDLLFLSQPHQGQAAARNLGLSHAKGEYLCALDSDDLLHPDFVEKSVRAIETVHADFVFSNWVIGVSKAPRKSIFEEFVAWQDLPLKASLEGWRLMRPDTCRGMYLDDRVSPSSSVLFRRQTILSGWEPSLKVCEDWCRLLDLVLRSPCRVFFTMEPLWTKRIRGDNLREWHYDAGFRKNVNVHDLGILYKRFRKLLTADERARLLARLAVHELWAAEDLQKLAARSAAAAAGQAIAGETAPGETAPGVEESAAEGPGVEDPLKLLAKEVKLHRRRYLRAKIEGLLTAPEEFRKGVLRWETHKRQILAKGL